MRIALVAPFGLRAKGTARARALPLGQALVRRGHQVTLFVPPYDSPADSGQNWTDGGVEVRHVRLPGRGMPGPLWHLDLAWRLLRAVRAWLPDIVHVFKPKGPSGLVGTALWFSRGRPPLVVDSDDWEGAGGWNDDARAGYSSARKRLFAWQERFGLSHADAWTVASDCLRGRALSFGAVPDRVYRLPNGISPASAPCARETEPAGGVDAAEAADVARTVVLYTRFAGVRVADVAAIWRRVLVAREDARLLVAGRGLAGEEAALAWLVPNVEVAGWVEPEALPALLTGAALALVPWADTPANRARNSAKVLDLMAAGLPLVGYAVGELPATVGDTGLLVPPADEAACAASVITLLNDFPQARRLGAAARERVLKLFDWDGLAEIACRAYGAARADISQGTGIR